MLVSDLPFLKNYWYPVAVASEVTDKPVTITLFGDQYVVWRRSDGAPTMVDPYCPHRSGNLGQGWISQDCIVCPYHGWEFDATGQCVSMPQLDPQTPIPSRAKVTPYPVRERYGMLWTCVGEPDGDVPIWNEAEEGGWRTFVEFFEPWEASAFRIIDNNLDMSHPAYVHRTTFGDPADAALIPTVEARPGGGLVTRLDRSVKGVGKQVGVTDDETVRFENRAEIDLLAPLNTHARFYFPDAPDYSFFGVATPIDDYHSMYMRLTALAGNDSEQPYDDFHEFGKRVKEEDRVLLEATKPDFPINVTDEIHLKTDRATVQYRRHLLELIDAHAGNPDRGESAR